MKNMILHDRYKNSVVSHEIEFCRVVSFTSALCRGLLVRSFSFKNCKNDMSDWSIVRCPFILEYVRFYHNY